MALDQGSLYIVGMGVAASRTEGGPRPAAADGRLRGWKEIGRWFGADERTVKRWETTRGLPIHRVPGDARAPVFAYETELADWLKSRGERAVPPVVPASAPAPRRRPVMLAAGAVLILVLAVLAWQGWDYASSRRQEAADRTADVRRLAGGQVAQLSDRLERQPGTVRLRAALASDAASVLARVAALPDAEPSLRHDAAEAYRRLAVVQFAPDRPSLRDRGEARAALDAGLRLVAVDTTREGRWLKARILADAARMAAGDGAVDRAPAMLKAAAEAAPDAPPALRDELALARSEVAQWRGDYAAAIAEAGRVPAVPPALTSEAALRQVRALDLAAEANFYAGAKPAALAGYRASLAAASTGARRWPDEPRWAWALRRQQWNLGSTLVDAGQPAQALPLLAAARSGWLAMAAADPEDESVASWVRTLRTSYAEALSAAGRHDAAIAELNVSVAERRAWLDVKPGIVERRRGLVVGLTALGDVLAAAGRGTEACAAYTEASGVLQRMTATGSVTNLDRDSIVRQLGENRARACSR